MRILKLIVVKDIDVDFFGTDCYCGFWNVLLSSVLMWIATIYFEMD